MKLAESPATRGNALLEAFPAEVRQQLDIHSENYKSHVQLVEGDSPPHYLYFPHHGTVISMTRTTETGATVEVGIIGSEGVAAVQALLAPKSVGSDGVVQIAGVASRIPLDQIRRALDENAVVRDHLLACTGAFLAQVSQHAVCNRLHTIEQRLAKWLLGVRDRIDSDQVDLTHDFLSHMLGIRRSGVTIAIGALALDGLLTHGRNSLTIRDREGLEARACECYCVIRDATPLLAGVEPGLRAHESH